jgi:23S rRNA (cytidine1920-2'-O)/16S rRNA (cytidine1409-2'-O)-methyltransferase
MARKGRHARLRKLLDVVAHAYPDLEDPVQAIVGRCVLVDGLIRDNPASLVRTDARVRIVGDAALRGEAKLTAALERFRVSVQGRIALDLGAAAGGFTRVLLGAGAARVYAVDVGFGQLLGSLRLDPRVVNLERTNLSALDRRLVPDEVELVTVDLSYLALGRAVAQLNERIQIADGADLIGLVKPQFELARSAPPVAAGELAGAVEAARAGIERAGWAFGGTMESPVRGAGGAIEFLVHARRRAHWI